MRHDLSNDTQNMRAWQKLLYLFLFGISSVIPILVVPGLLSNTPLATLDKSQLLVLATVLAAYAAACSVLTFAIILSVRFRTLVMIVSGSIIYGIPLLAAILYQNVDIRHLIIYAFCVSIALLIVFARGFRSPRMTVLSMAVISTILFGLGDLPRLSDRIAGTLKTTSLLRPAFYNLQLTIYPADIPRSVRGGGIEKFSDQYLAATGDGRLYTFDLAPDVPKLHFSMLPVRVPLNTDEFVAAASDRVDVAKFRVADILVKESGESIEIYASHHFWRSDDRCFVMRISTISGTANSLMRTDAESRWKTLFETTPCLPIKDKGHTFGGHQVGGRMALRGDQLLVIAVGDHEFDGNTSDIAYSQDMTSSYGKTIAINLETGQQEILSVGHRNPQGIYVDPRGTIWLTEHGPQGGDELNLIKKGSDYGWPSVTYGTAYGMRRWPLSKNQGAHEGFERPIFSWLPSIGVSSLIGIESDRFSLWKSDLLVSSLHGGRIYRLRIRENRVIYVEPMKIEKRIRDILEGHSGEIVFWTDDSSIGVIDQVANNNDGGALFSMCTGCHAIDNGRSHGIGPDLKGMFGRKAGTAPAYDYSNTLKDLDRKWTPEFLDDYLANPDQVAPGTTMVFPGISDESTRAKLIQFLLDNT